MMQTTKKTATNFIFSVAAAIVLSACGGGGGGGSSKPTVSSSSSSSSSVAVTDDADINITIDASEVSKYSTVIIQVTGETTADEEYTGNSTSFVLPDMPAGNYSLNIELYEEEKLTGEGSLNLSHDHEDTDALVVITPVDSGAEIAPLPEGSGTFSVSLFKGATYELNETDGTIAVLANPLPTGYLAVDYDSEGYVYGADQYDQKIDLIDIRTGEAKLLFATEYELSNMAVTPDDTITAITEPQDFQTRYLVELSLEGEELSRVEITSDFQGIDFDSSGRLLGVGAGALYEINRDTGEYTEISMPVRIPGALVNDIDISPADELRTISQSGGGLTIFSVEPENYGVIDEITLQQDHFSFSPVIHR
ncbi:hypothetical protein [Gilvimarinus chinensis]|uniref:hypothetical protein n=1 Tax=Gilvimarinus chinensis TaxID=396005 RepID=UPI0012FAC26C|nr:hypothetical protein [Gilvimarinus chinensis]